MTVQVGSPRPSPRNPYLFIVGCARSGTTLLRRIVGAHSQIAMTPESHWIPRFYRDRNGLTPDGRVTPAFVSHLFDYERFGRFRVSREAIEQLIATSGPMAYAECVSKIYDLFGEAQGKRLVADKTGAYVRFIGLLHDLWPEVRFVHIIRDGRDVCLSVLDWRKSERYAERFVTWEEDPVSTNALWWKWRIQHGRDAGRPLGASLYHELHYEALVTQPAAACASLCAFLGVPYEEAMLRFHEGRTEPGRDAKSAWWPITPGLRDWRTQMAPEAVERYEAVAGDLLEELGYERAYPHVSVAVTDRAAKITERFNRQIAERSNEQAQSSSSMLLAQ